MASLTCTYISVGVIFEITLKSCNLRYYVWFTCCEKNKITDLTWPWNCLSANCPNNFEPLKNWGQHIKVAEFPKWLMQNLCNAIRSGLGDLKSTVVVYKWQNLCLCPTNFGPICTGCPVILAYLVNNVHFWTKLKTFKTSKQNKFHPLTFQPNLALTVTLAKRKPTPVDVWSFGEYCMCRKYGKFPISFKGVLAQCWL